MIERMAALSPNGVGLSLTVTAIGRSLGYICVAAHPSTQNAAPMGVEACLRQRRALNCARVRRVDGLEENQVMSGAASPA